MLARVEAYQPANWKIKMKYDLAAIFEREVAVCYVNRRQQAYHPHTASAHNTNHHEFLIHFVSSFY